MAWGGVLELRVTELLVPGLKAVSGVLGCFRVVRLESKL